MTGGAVIIDKPQGITSQGAVNAVRKIFSTKKVGHTGTLDPMATGVLVVLVGNAVKASEYLVSETKSYDASIRLGVITDTQDTTGKVLYRHEGQLPTFEEFTSVLKKFTGEIMQTPPMYSALKVEGAKLCDLARKGIEVERTARPVNIYSLTAEKTQEDILLHINCSKGTYIRTLCDDIGKALGCGAAMSALRRTANGKFTASQAISPETLAACERPQDKLIPLEELFSDCKKIKLPPFYARLAACGNEIYTGKIGVAAEVGQRALLYGEELICLSECHQFENGIAYKCLKMF